jgi:hypothetical protein
LKIFWLFRRWLIKVLGEKIANEIIWKLIYTFGGYAITKSFCSIFPLRQIIESPSFDMEIEKASKDYLAAHPMTTNIKGFSEWQKEREITARTSN